VSDFKLLVVEDDERDLKTCRATVKRYSKERDLKIQIVECVSLEEVASKLDNSFDGAIVDLKLAKNGDEGNEVVKNIHDHFRIPIAILTGTPENANADNVYIGIHKKGETGYDDLLDMFFQIYDTGLTKIMGGRGVIEQAMDKVFWNNILPQLESWKSYATSGINTENALLRFAINHLTELLDENADTCFPEEMYLVPPVSTHLKTGSIVSRQDTGENYLILSPACDLALHAGNIKTDRILVCLVEPHNISIIEKAKKNSRLEILETDNGEEVQKKRVKKENAERLLQSIPRNNYSNFYHFLPKTSSYQGGIVNFRKISTYRPKDFHANFNAPSLQITTAFIKDIIARFSSYYARQGQPDFDFTFLSETLKNGVLE
jgi:CheY-like chemotaxis protein